MSFGATTLSSPYQFDEPWIPLVSPIESCVLTTRAQPGVGLAAPWRLTFSNVLRAGFAT